MERMCTNPKKSIKIIKYVYLCGILAKNRNEMSIKIQ